MFRFRRGLAVGWPGWAVLAWFFAWQIGALVVTNSVDVSLPRWVQWVLLASLYGTAPAPMLLRRRCGTVPRSRARAGKCLKCGYDLRVSRDVCPECGRRVPRRVRLGRARSPEAVADE